MTNSKKTPSAFLAMLPLVLLVMMLVVTVRAYGSDSLLGASQVTLLAVSACCVLIGTLFLRIPFKDFERAITHNISSVTSAILILLFIGSLSGTWMVSGVVPSLIFYGIKIIRPEIFLFSSCIISAMVSIMTGSSWTTIATIGIALMGIGRAQGFEDGWIAGAIISGAYFGDKISPLSDTTVLASGTLNVSIFKHIRYMLITTIPSLAISLVIFLIAGFCTASNSNHEINQFTTALSSRFTITPWLLIVPVVTGVMIAKRLPPVVTLCLSTLLAVVFALIFQPQVLAEIVDGNLFKGAMQSIYGETSVQTTNPMLTSLVATRGMQGMMNTIWLIICAMCFGGAMEAGGMVRSLTRLFVRMIHGRVSMVASTVCSGLMLNLAIADQYICILLSNNMFKRIYDRQGYECCLLSRTTEDSVTVTSVLVPWNTCGMTQSTVLGVATLTYLPYCFFNILSPLMSVVIAMIGYKIKKKEVVEDETLV